MSAALTVIPLVMDELVGRWHPASGTLYLNPESRTEDQLCVLADLVRHLQTGRPASWGRRVRHLKAVSGGAA